MKAKPNIQDIERIITALEQNQRPSEFHTLSGGLSESTIGTFDNNHYILKSLKASQHKKREYDCSLYASSLGVAPKVYDLREIHAVGIEKHYLVTDCIQGRTVHPEEIASIQTYRNRVIDKIRRLHTSKPSCLSNSLSYPERINHHIERSGIKLPNAVMNRFNHLKKSLVENPLGLGFTHNDLHVGNIMKSTDDEIFIVDWTDAGIGDILADFALFTSEFSKPIGEKQLLYYLDEQCHPALLQQFYLRREIVYILRTCFALEQAKKRCESDAEWQALQKNPEAYPSYQALYSAARNKEILIESKESFMIFAKSCIKSIKTK